MTPPHARHLWLRKGDAHCSRPVSISFREERPETILREAAAAGLSGIEWGGMSTSPPGDLDTARSVAPPDGRRRAPGIRLRFLLPSGMSANPASDFLPVLDTAEALGAPFHPLVGRAEGIGCPVPAGIRTDGRRDANSCRAGRRTGDYP